jgi:signal transduction histidine kinase
MQAMIFFDEVAMNPPGWLMMAAGAANAVQWTRRRRAVERESELRGLMTMATHDLKSPLAAAAIHLEMLREDRAEQIGADGEEHLRATERALGRVNGLVEDLLTYSAADQRAMDRRPVPLGEMVDDVIAGCVAGSAVTARGPLPTVLADPGLLRHVLENLVGNAVKYTPAGVPAEVEVSARPGPGGAVRVEVADRGIGIPEADRPRVFDAFHRSANSGPFRGTGLGLAICRRIIERHGGRIGVDENPGGGSRFWFTLPAPAGSEKRPG